MAVSIDEKGVIKESKDEVIDEETILDFKPVDRDDEWTYKELIEKNIEAMLKSPSTPIDLKRRIAEAQEIAHNRVTDYGSSRGPQLLIKDDTQRTATALDGGAFYTLLYQMPGLTLKFRAKKGEL